MVLKKSKFGGNTGNTLRKSSKTAGKVRPVSFVETTVREKKPLFEERKTKVWLHDGGITQEKQYSLNANRNTVQYSLNKDKRWSLYDDITSQLSDYKTNVTHEKENSKQHFKPLDESVAVIRKPGDWLPLTARHNDYTKSFHDSNDMQENFERNSWRSSAKLENKYDKTYTFKEGFPSATFPQLASKIPNFNAEDRVSIRKGKNRLRKVDFDILDDEDDWTWVYGGGYMDDELPCPRGREFSLLEFLKTNDNSQFQDKSSAFPKKKYTDTKSHIHVVEKLEDIGIVTTKIEENSNVVEEAEPLQSFTIQVKTEAITPIQLKDNYQGAYLEGDCKPRCFAIFDYMKSDVKALFECVCTEADNTFLIVKLYSPDPIEYLQDIDGSAVMDFDYFIELLFPRLNSNCDVVFQAGPSNSSNSDKLKNFLSTREIPEILFENIATYNQSPELVEEDIFNGYITVCTVCLDEGAMTTLNICGHSFCNTCWKKYIETKILLGNTTISCLDFDCDEDVSFLTVLKFSSKKLFSSYYKQLCNNLILKNPALKMCPNEKCQRVAIATEYVAEIDESGSSKTIKKDIPIVKCVCKKQWCFQCQNDSHWPVSCKLHDRYKQQLQKDMNVLYDKKGNIFETTIYYRTCPHCKSKIVKNGGCPYMSCICGKNFCWRCLKSFDNHENCYSASDKSVVFSSLDEELPGTSKSTKIFRNALKHKIARSKISKLKSRLKIYTMQKKLIIDAPENSLLAMTIKAISVLDECYEIMENLSLVFAEKDRVNYKARKLLDSLFWFSNMLWDNLDVKTLSHVNLPLLENQLTFIRVLMRKLREL